MHKPFILFVFLYSVSISSQELNCEVIVNHDQIAGSNRQVFQTLETAISEFVNQKKWTVNSVKPHERINCVMNIIITNRDNNLFEGSIQVQSTRPIYSSSYESPVLNIRDNDFNFKYNEFDQFIFNPTAFDSNLIATISFYVYLIIGVDADTFALNGGERYLRQAQNIALQAQQSGLSAWSNQVGLQNRFQLIDNLLTPNLEQYRISMYHYHRKGFDEMVENLAKAKAAIENAMISLEKLNNKAIGNRLLRVFFDAKSNEIVNLYSGGPNTRSKQRLRVVLQKISPNNSASWRKIN